ncbi:MAG: CsbD family protein [Oligoflexia bacterium]|nr:CsbD family protein [Oligoflexia bacterium]
MNWQEIEGQWDQLKGRIRTKWGKLTDDDLSVIHGKYEELLGKLKERYGYAKERAEQEVDEFTRSFKKSSKGTKKQDLESFPSELDL